MRELVSTHEFIEIPEGFSCIGSDELDPYASEKEIPLREVFISTFYISKYPTTVKQYGEFLRAVIGEIPPSIGDRLDVEGDYPITNVSWERAMDYCDWLGELSGKLVVLPSEAEWEKAARGGDSRIWPWGNTFDPQKCNCSENGKNTLCSVYDFPNGASPYGGMHFSGNVWEWCQDYWHPFAHQDMIMINPINQLPAERRVVKGGSAFCSKEIVRPACRDWTNSINQGGGDDGFRVAIRTK